MYKILIADKLDPTILKDLALIPRFETTVKTGMKEEELTNLIPNFDAIVVRSATKVNCNVLKNAKNLKVIVRAGIGLDNIDCAIAKENNIEVFNTPTATSISVAEQTFGLMISAIRNIAKANLSMKAHKWEKKLFSGTELYGKVLGIVGMGRIGQEVAKRALAFGMKIIANDIRKIETNLDITEVSLNEILAQSDIITFHLPLTDNSKHMISFEEFSKMRDGVVIINASRGGIIDEEALLDALNKCKVRSAALDVFEKEPPVNFSLIDHPNVIATPHLGAQAKEGQERAGSEVIRILKERLLKING